MLPLCFRDRRRRPARNVRAAPGRVYDRSASAAVLVTVALALIMTATLQRFRLDNGLTVLLAPNRLAPVVATQAWIGVGSADETATTAGIAHVFEHMLFKGTARRGVGDIASTIESAGGDINAWTSFNQTVFHVVLASRFFETAVDVLADALQHSAFDPTELEREREVILEEIRQGADDPVRNVAQALFSTAYVSHPYRRPVIGGVATVKRFTREHLLDFFHRWYVASNVTLVVSGDIEPEPARKIIERHFGGMARGAPRRQRHVEPPQVATRAVVLSQDTSEAYVALGYHVPPLRHPDTAALDVAASVLGQGESSRLNVEVRRHKEAVTSTYAYVHSLIDPGMFVISATLRPEKLHDATAALGGELARLAAGGISVEELDKARHGIEADTIYQLETAQGQARKHGFYELTAGDARWEEEYLDEVRRLTPARVRDAVRRHLGPDSATIAALLPSGGRPSSERARTAEGKRLVTRLQRATVAARPAPPPARKPGKGRSARDPDLVRAVLPGGLRVVIKRDPSVPVVAMRVVWTGGVRLEQESDNGISALLASVLTRGCGDQNADALAATVDRMAGGLAGIAGRNSLGIRAEWLAASWEKGFGLVADCVLTPRFDADEVARQRRRLLDELEARKESPGHAVFRLFAETLYRRHPYRFDVDGTPASVARLTRKRLIDFYRSRFPVGAMTLAVVGDVDPARVLELAKARFGAASLARAPKAAAPPAVEAEVFTGRSAASREVYRYLDREQAHLVIGFPGTTVDSADRHALEVLATILGGQGGRLFVELRDRQSLAYRVSAFSVDGLDPGYIAVYLSCSPDKIDAAVAGIRLEVDRIVAEGPTEAEVERATRYLIGAHEISLQRRSVLATALAYHEAYGLGYDRYLSYGAEIGKITAADVKRAARRYLDWDVAVTATVRPTSMSPGAIKKRDGKGKPPRPPRGEPDPRKGSKRRTPASERRTSARAVPPHDREPEQA
jgi:zinc protease